MFVRRLTEEDVETLWRLRLRALSDNAEAFGTTYGEAVAQGNAAMLQRLRSREDEGFYLGAFERTLVGMIGFLREDGVKDRHKGSVTSLYVLPEARGQGVGKALVRELGVRAKRLAGLEQLHLAVVAGLPAASLYHSLGFEVYGTMRRSLKMGEQYWDEELMVLYV